MEKVGSSKIEFKKPLSLATKETYFVFSGKLYKQVDGVAIGSPLGPRLAKAFLVYFEMNWLQSRLFDFKPHYYWRYVDNIFVSFTTQEHLEAFCNFLNGLHANMSFTIKSEKQNRISFLDVQIIREDKTFTTSVFHKPTFSGVYTDFDNFLPSFTYKFGRQTRIKLRKSLKNILNCCKLQIVLKSKTRLGNNFHFKDRIPKYFTSGVVYKYQCGLCSESYYGKCVKHLNVRIG